MYISLPFTLSVIHLSAPPSHSHPSSFSDSCFLFLPYKHELLFDPSTVPHTHTHTRNKTAQRFRYPVGYQLSYNPISFISWFFFTDSLPNTHPHTHHHLDKKLTLLKSTFFFFFFFFTHIHIHPLQTTTTPHQEKKKKKKVINFDQLIVFYLFIFIYWYFFESYPFGWLVPLFFYEPYVSHLRNKKTKQKKEDLCSSFTFLITSLLLQGLSSPSLPTYFSLLKIYIYI